MYLLRNKKLVRGFTLIELLVVIAIIGVLASVVLASLNNARRKSRDARRITDVKQIQLALELFFDGAGAGNYPVAVAPPCTLGAPPVVTDSNGLQGLAMQNYIAVIPRDPSNVATCYVYASLLTTYHLGATLEDVNNPALNGDRDCTSVGAGCGSGPYTAGFDGAVAAVYDVTP